jgi:hypothetical protein
MFHLLNGHVQASLFYKQKCELDRSYMSQDQEIELLIVYKRLS